VIWESYYWKNDLCKRAAWLQKRLSQKRWVEASFARLEQCIMLGFYSIRRLIEARKLSDITITHQLRVSAYSSFGKPVTLYNWHNLDQLYDLDSGQPISRDVRFLCNQFIHSYVFLPAFRENGSLASILVASEYERSRSLYDVAVAQIIGLFELVGIDYPNESVSRFNKEKQDYDVSAVMHVGGNWA